MLISILLAEDVEIIFQPFTKTERFSERLFLVLLLFGTKCALVTVNQIYAAMKTDENTKRRSLNMRSMFRCMMEEGYYPTYEQTHIQFGIDDNIAVVEYDEGILSVRLFFSIDQESYGLFLEASNLTMTGTYAVKPAILDDMKNIMFSCEVMCDNLREFRKFLPRAIERLNEALMVHKDEMKKLVIAGELAAKTIPATDDSMAGIGIRQKLLS